MEIVIDNFMFEYLTSEAGFQDVQYLLNQFKQRTPEAHSLHAPTSPVLSSPKSPMARLPASPVLSSASLRPRVSQRTRTSSLTDSSLLVSSGVPRIQQFFTKDKSQLVVKGRRITIYHEVPKKIIQYQNVLLGEIKLTNSFDLNLGFTPSRNVIDRLHDCELVFEQYFNFRPKERTPLTTIGDWICEELLNIPRFLLKRITQLYPQHFVSFAAFFIFLETVINIPPQKRLFFLLGDIISSTKQYFISIVHMVEIVRQLIDANDSWDFVQPENYRQAFCQTATIQLLYEANFQNWWFDFESSIKGGVDILFELWQSQERTEVAEEPGFLGYEQFYVLYCLFARYGQPQYLKQIQLCSYNEFCYSTKAIERIFQGFGHNLYADYMLNSLRGSERRFELDYQFETQVLHGFQYQDFIYLVLADTCIDNYNACRFWFNVADVDADNLISEDDFDNFVLTQQRQWERKNLDLQLRDVKMQFMDMINQDFPFNLDLVYRSRMHQNLFDCMFSASKFEQFESRDAYVANPQLQAEDNGFGKSHFDSKIWASFWVAVYEQLAAD